MALKGNNMTEAETKQLKEALMSPAMKKLVADWLVTKAKAQALRESVDGVYAKIMTEVPAYATLDKGERIYDHRELYLCADDELCARIYDLADKREKAAGIKPADMHPDHCPALTAEYDLIQIEHEIADLSGSPVGITVDRLLCDGLETYRKWIDLVVGGALALDGSINSVRSGKATT